nr:hypothetical protein [Tanacetum cinerariifolium]
TSCFLPKNKLRFAVRLVAFCFKARCVLLQDSCILLQSSLCFALKLVAFCFKARCVLLQDSCILLQSSLCFALKLAAFCFNTSCVLLQDPCVLSQDSCDLSHGGIAFCLLLKALSTIVLRDLILHRSSINNSASLSNKFRESYFIFKFDEILTDIRDEYSITTPFEDLVTLVVGVATLAVKYQAQQNKPATKTERRDFYTSILRSITGWKAKDLKGMTFEQTEEKFILVWEKMQDFVPMNSKLESERLKRPKIQLGKESFKKLKTSEVLGTEPTQEQQSKEPKELSELKKMIEIVPVKELYIEALQVKYPIID